MQVSVGLLYFNILYFLIVPSKPNAPIVEEVTDHSVILSWSPPTSHTPSACSDNTRTRRDSIHSHKLLSTTRYRRESVVSNSGSEIDLIQNYSGSSELIYCLEEKTVDKKFLAKFKKVYK